MCFEFEWLYWAQLAQEKAQNQDTAGQASTPAQSPTRAARQSQTNEPDPRREPAHA